MLNDRTVQGTHFACFHAGPMKGWTDFKLEPSKCAGADAGKVPGRPDCRRLSFFDKLP
jgi:hypothetical protein